MLAALSARAVGAPATEGAAAKTIDYRFDGTISRETLENYLERSVTMAFFLVTGVPEPRRSSYPYRDDDVRLIRNIGARFIGRAMYRWGGESRLNEPGFWSRARDLIEKVHAFDAEIIFQGRLTPSGWRCESLPYLVELDNYGRSRRPNVADTSSIFVWGWDEISWFAQQSEPSRNRWLEYAHDWIRKNDPSGHLQMPVSRMISCPKGKGGTYRANTRSAACPIGSSQEETIKRIWAAAER